MSIELAIRLFEDTENAVALKEESGDVAWAGEFIQATQGQVPVVAGGGEMMAPYYLLAGASAYIRKILDAMGLEEEVYSSVEDALLSFLREAPVDELQ